MIKKDAQFKWMSVEKEYFEKVKSSIAQSPALQSPGLLQIFLVIYIFL
jgi:hypothetical protein